MIPHKKPSEKQRELAEEILDLCESTFPKMFKDMQRVALMRPFDYDYYNAHFKVLADEFSAIFLLQVLVSNPGKFDWSYLKYYWRDLRNIVAKYTGDGKDPRILAIDKRYSMFLWRLPKIVVQPRPTKPLPREWWDSNPDREKIITTVALTWWGIPQTPDLEFEDLDINNKRFEDMESIECLGSIGVVHSTIPVVLYTNLKKKLRPQDLRRRMPLQSYCATVIENNTKLLSILSF